jgi:hypothetical protein
MRKYTNASLHIQADCLNTKAIISSVLAKIPYFHTLLHIYFTLKTPFGVLA